MLCGCTLPLNGMSRHVLLLWDNKYRLQDQFNDCIFDDLCTAPRLSFLHHTEASPVYFCSHCLGTQLQGLGQGTRTFTIQRHIVSLQQRGRGPILPFGGNTGTHEVFPSLLTFPDKGVAWGNHWSFAGPPGWQFEALVSAILLSIALGVCWAKRVVLFPFYTLL